MTTSLWFSVVNLILKHVDRIFQTLSLESQYVFKTSYHRNEPNQNINTTWQITDVSNVAKWKVNILKTWEQMYRCHEPHVHTISHFPVLPSFFINTYYRCCNSDFCSTAQLGLSLWPPEQGTPPWSWRQCCTAFHSLEIFLVERVERFEWYYDQIFTPCFFECIT